MAADARTLEKDAPADADPLSLSCGLCVDITGDFATYLTRDIADILAGVSDYVEDDFTNTEMSLTLTDDQTVQALNRDWRGKDKPTNVLSFPGDEDSFDLPSADEKPPRHLGDIIIALETVQRESHEAGKMISDHLTHLIVHGMLHLLGYDHISDDEAAVMEALETRLLAQLGIKDPYNSDYA